MILNRQRRIAIRRVPLEQFLRRLRRLFALPEEAVSVCLLSDAAMARLNRAFRGRRGSTDVLSFPANGNRQQIRAKKRKGLVSGRRRSASVAPGRPAPAFSSPDSLLGDIAISPAVAARNARRYGRTLQDELRILVLHGVLHLLGYDHETDRGEMEARERRLRRRLRLG